MEANNMAAMLEALEEVSEWAETHLRDYGADWELHNQLCDKLKAARAMPKRNCDVGTAEEQIERFNHQCFEHHTGRCSRNCKTLPAKTFQECALKWAQMPYEADSEEGGAK